MLRTIALIIFAVSACWLAAVAVMWMAGTNVPTVNVRWKAGISDAERAKAETYLTLVLHEPKEPGTNNYFILDTSAHNVGALVQHPLIEDTAFIDRGSFTLDNPPAGRMWLGTRFSKTLLLGSLYLSIFGFLTGGIALAPEN